MTKGEGCNDQPDSNVQRFARGLALQHREAPFGPAFICPEAFHQNAARPACALRTFAASKSPARKTPKSIFMGKTPPQTKKSFPQAWGLIPQTSPTNPQTWGFNGDTWGIIAEAWGRGVEAGPTFPHVSKLGVVSRKHPADPWGKRGETWRSFPQPWGTNPQMWEHESHTWGMKPQASPTVG